MRLKAVCAFIVISVLGLIVYGLVAGARQLVGTQNTPVAEIQSEQVVRADDEAVEKAMKGLWAGDDAERQGAKEQLLRLGTRAITPLISLLADLTRNPIYRYTTGKAESEAAEIRARLNGIPKHSREQRVEAVRRLANLDISQRLKEDVCELLGRSRAEEAIPFLIEAMEQQEGMGKWERMDPAMNALVEIGATAVPKLLEAMETARERVVARDAGDAGVHSQFMIRSETATYQARSAMILERIGDERALPILEHLKNTTDSEPLIPYLERAITACKKKHRQT